MARPLRIEHLGGWYHITSRGNERRAVFRADRDRVHCWELLAEMPQRFGVSVCCFALMDNHYHLLLRLRDQHLSRALQWLNLSYTLWFNRRHDRHGHLFQGRFQSILFDPTSSALELSRYVHLNPIRVARLGLGKPRRAAAQTGRGETPTAAEIRARLAHLRNYRWSSYRAYIGASPSPIWLDSEAILGMNRGTLPQQREAYRQYAEAAAREGTGSAGVWADLKRRLPARRPTFSGQGARPHLWWLRATRRRPVAARPTRLGRNCSRGRETGWGKMGRPLRTRHGDTTRDLALHLGRRCGGLKLRELAAAAGLAHYGAVAMAVRRYERKLAGDRGESRRLKRTLQLLNVKI